MLINEKKSLIHSSWNLFNVNNCLLVFDTNTVHLQLQADETP